MQFILSSTKKGSFLRSRYFISFVLWFTVLVVGVGVTFYISCIDVWSECDVTFNLIWLGAFVIASIIFLYKQRSIKEFEINDMGINIRKKLYPWNIIKHYHWLGEAQSERTGVFGLRGIGYDILNPYKFSDAQVARIHIHKNWLFRYYINLEIDKENINNFDNLLQQKGKQRVSRLRQFLGIEF